MDESPVHVPVPVTSMPPLVSRKSGTGGVSQEEEGSSDELPMAQGQELLGPCRECDGYWTREIVRGQKPLTCPVCKREGQPS